MLAKMQRAEFTQRRNQEIVEWVNEHPEVKAAVEKRIKNVPAENRERAFLSVAKSEAMRTGMRVGNGVAP